jgi:hypothetical protein
MGLVLKLLQCINFLGLHTLVIGEKLLKELNDKVKNRKNPCLDSWTIATTPRCKRTFIAFVIVVDGVGVNATS